LISQLAGEREQLLVEAGRAKAARGLDVSPELQTANLSTMFGAFAAWDASQGVSGGSMGAAAAGWRQYHEGWSSESAATFGLSIPCLQLNETLAVVRAARGALAVATNASVVRKPVPPTDPLPLGAVLSPSDGLVHASDGRVLFPQGQCGYACFAALTQGQLEQLRGSGPVAGTSWVGVSAGSLLLAPAAGTAGGSAPALAVNRSEVARVAAATGRLAADGQAVHLYLRQDPMPP